MSVNAVEKIKFQTEVLESTKPAVVEFWAPWCGYCRRLAPAVERLEAEIGSKVTVLKADIDELPEIAQQYGIDTIPTLILFKDGKEADRVVNPPSQDAVEEWLKTNQVL